MRRSQLAKRRAELLTKSPLRWRDRAERQIGVSLNEALKRRLVGIKGGRYGPPNCLSVVRLRSLHRVIDAKL